MNVDQSPRRSLGKYMPVLRKVGQNGVPTGNLHCDFLVCVCVPRVPKGPSGFLLVFLESDSTLLDVSTWSSATYRWRP